MTIIREIYTSGGNPSLVNLKTTNCDSIELELEIRPTILAFDKLRQIAERNSLKYRENNGKAIIF